MGFWSREQIFTNISFVDLIDDDVNDPRARTQATAMGMESGGSIFDSYKDNYFVGFRRQYRRRMSENLLRKYGFLPETTTIFQYDFANYITTIGGSDFISSEILTPESDSNNGVFFPEAQDLSSICQKNYGNAYNPVANTLTGVTIGASSGNFSDITWNDTSILDIENAYLEATLDGGGATERIPNSSRTYSGVPANDTGVPARMDSIYSFQFTRSSDGATVYETGFIVDLPDSAYDESTLLTTPIIMLKEENVMNPALDSEGTGAYWEMSRMLDRIGLDGNDLVNELQYGCDTDPAHEDGNSYDSPDPAIRQIVECFDGEGNPYIGQTYHVDGTPQKECGDCNKSQEEDNSIDNAYITTGIYPGGKTQGELTAMWAFFDAFADTLTEQFTASLNSIDIQYEFIAHRTAAPGIYVDDGVPLKMNEYASVVMETAEDWDDDGDYVIPGTAQNSQLQLIYQVSNEAHEIINVKHYKQTTSIITEGERYSHASWLYYDPETEEEDVETLSRIIVPLDIYNTMKYKRWVEVYERGMNMTAYSYEVVKLKWYQTGVFKILVVVILIVITVLSAGTAAGATAAALANLVSQMLVSMIVSAIAGAVSDDPMLLAIIAIAGMAYGGFDINALTQGFDGFLKTANQLLGTVNKVNAAMEAKSLAADMDKLKALQDEIEEYDDAFEEKFVLESGAYTSGGGAQSAKASVFDPQSWIENANGSNMHNTDSLYDVTGAIEGRLNS